MAYVTRAMRRKMADDYREERYGKKLNAERIRNRQANEQALAETFAKYPVLTTENFEEANDYREARVRELLGAN